MRARLKADPVKYKSFLDKLSLTISNQWATLDQSVRIQNSLKNSRNGKWLGVVKAEDTEKVMKANNLKAPWSDQELDELFFGEQSWQ
jgi:hypothetical protein